MLGGVRYRAGDSLQIDGYAKYKGDFWQAPYRRTESLAAAGLAAAWRVDGFALSVGGEFRQSFRDTYGDWDGTGFELKTGIARQLILSPALSVTPAWLVSHFWSNQIGRERWKTELSAPLNYTLTDKLSLQPVIPTVAMQAFTHRRVGRRDWTYAVATGATYKLTRSLSVGAAVGFEQRESNVATAEYSRWLVMPRLQMRLVY